MNMFQDSNASKVQKPSLKSKRKATNNIRKKQNRLKKSPYHRTSSFSKNKNTSRSPKTSKGNNVASKQDTFFGTAPYAFFSQFVKQTVSSMITEATLLVHFDQQFEQAWQISIQEVLAEASSIVDDLENSIRNSL